MMRHLLIFLFCFLGIFGNIAAQTVSNRDNSKVEERHLDTVLLQERMTEDAFQYDTQEIEGEGWFKKMVRWLLDQIFDDVEAADISLTEKIIKWGLVIAAVIVVIYFASKLRGNRFIQKTNKPAEEVRFMDFEGSKTDLEKALEDAENTKDYQLAMRYLFIMALSYLEAKGVILWKKEKTNADYLRELQEEWSKTPMQRLSILFSYGIYGSYEIDEEKYREAKNLFHRMKEKGESS